MHTAQDQYHLSERTACRIVGQPRGTQRYVPTLKPDEDELTRSIIYLASQYARYGYRRVAALLNNSGIEVGKDRVQRILRREGLKVPKKQPNGLVFGSTMDPAFGFAQSDPITSGASTLLRPKPMMAGAYV